MRLFFFLLSLITSTILFAQQTHFEKSNGAESSTYFEAIAWYKKLDQLSAKVLMKEVGPTDAGYPLHVVLISNDGKFEVAKWRQQKKAIVMVNNGIHPGEPDGIDASMMLVRDIVNGKVKIPDNVALAIIPVYNIGGCLNRSSTSRVNQNGPAEYGFRGNAQNLDLNRDFTKSDSKNARAFAKIFHELDPDILIDNHVSDGADYQHTFTLLTTQYDKLGSKLGNWLKEKFEPQLFKGMADKKWDICPYVNFEEANFENGMEMFYDPPRYSSGYAALFQTIAFMPETHMLKPFKERVWSTYAFMQTMIEKASANSAELFSVRMAERNASIQQTTIPLAWKVDSSAYSDVVFKGYEQGFKTSEVTGLQRMFYDRSKPFEKHVNFYNVFKTTVTIKKASAYIIPQGWRSVIDLLKLNGVVMKQIAADTMMEAEVYHIDDFKSYPVPYEKHHKNYAVKTSAAVQTIKILKGAYIVSTNQPASRYITEMLEPTGDDSFFSWNFFDAILQQKEGYSEYRWEDVAAEFIKQHPEVKQELDAKKASDAAFAKDVSAQLAFVYKHSPYYEPAHLRYPVFRIL